MITRLYAHNFRCLVAFETQLSSFGVLCGPNGAGKSSVFDALQRIRDLGTGKAALGGDGPNDITKMEFTNWLDSTIQEFEIEIRAKEHVFVYCIHIEQTDADLEPRIIKEEATCDGRRLFSRDLEGVTFTKQDGSQSGFPLDWQLTALGTIQPIGALRDVELLQESLERILILRPCPLLFESESRSEARQPSLHLDNLLSWYRSLAQEQEWTDVLRDSLQNVWPDFKSFKLVNAGLYTKSLQLRFDGSQNRDSEPYHFDALSDGEKTLIGLYMIHATMETYPASDVFIDEPDNYVGLPELQPWVLSIRELLDEQHQAILISHHPEVLGNACEDSGFYLWRDHHASPTRIGPLKVPDGLTVAEAIARGWINGQ